MEPSGNAEPLADDLAGTAPNMADLVAFLNAEHGTTYRLTDRLLHGKRNVAGLYNAGGARFIVKWSAGDRDLDRLAEAVRLVDRLRSRWYPVPRYVARGLHAGGRYVVQTALPGAPVTRLNASLVSQLVALNEIQRDLAVSPSPAPWPARVADDVIHGGNGYCLLEPMRQHSPTTARLLDLVQELVARHRDLTTPVADIVHFDFQQTNLLGLSGKISGVVDWDGAGTGDRAFDLATLLFYAYAQAPARDALWPHVTSITDPAAIGVYLAHLIHRQVDWSIRHDEPAAIEYWLERARLVLREIPDRTGCAVSAWP